VGDIQQPLHCSAAVWASNLDGDAGGNQFYLTGNWTQLHSLWDAGGGYLTDGTSVSAKAADVEAAYPYAASIGTIPDPMGWAFEGREIARTNTYVGITINSTPSAAYLNTAQATAKQRMASGGQCLAKLLNTIFVTNGPTAIATTVASGNFSFTWRSVSGRVYRVQSKQQITDPAWTDLTDVTATTNAAVFSEIPDPTATQRFYRAIIVN
jgi:hypothetical protein